MAGSQSCSFDSLQRHIYLKLPSLCLLCRFIGLGYLGHEGVSSLRTMMARVFTLGYFAFFLLMPFYTSIEKTKPLPERVT